MYIKLYLYLSFKLLKYVDISSRSLLCGRQIQKLNRVYARHDKNKTWISPWINHKQFKLYDSESYRNPFFHCRYILVINCEIIFTKIWRKNLARSQIETFNIFRGQRRTEQLTLRYRFYWTVVAFCLSDTVTSILTHFHKLCAFFSHQKQFGVSRDFDMSFLAYKFL